MCRNVVETHELVTCVVVIVEPTWSSST